MFENIFEDDVLKRDEVVNMLYARLEVRRKYLPSASHAEVPLDPRGGRVRAQPRLGIREAKHKFTTHKNKTRCIKR